MALNVTTEAELRSLLLETEPGMVSLVSGVPMHVWRRAVEQWREEGIVVPPRAHCGPLEALGVFVTTPDGRGLGKQYGVE